MPTTQIGSYANAFAPRDFAPHYPGLRKGLVLDCGPELGPSGSNLRDWAPYRMHSTLTNFTLANAWVVGQGRYAIQQDGTSTYIDLANALNRVKALTQGGISIWVYATTIDGSTNGSAAISMTTSLVNTNQVTIEQNTSSGDIRFLVRSGSTLIDAASPTGLLVLNTWTHIVVTVDASGNKMYVNGKQVTLTYTTGSSSTQAFFSSLAAPTNFQVSSIVTIGGVRSRYWKGQTRGFAIWDRPLTGNEPAILASRPGVLYEYEARNRLMTDMYYTPPGPTFPGGASFTRTGPGSASFTRTGPGSAAFTRTGPGSASFARKTSRN